jgi:predicted 3-demethylubiquinone-9 3-methyltransferase (glyoxalase superfamily)
MPKSIYPCLWFEGQAKAAAEFYCDVFPDSRIVSSNPIVVNFEINGSPFIALNDRRPEDHFNESVSFVIPCENQEEIDYYWDRLTADGGKESMCGWCSDQYGVSWQVIPAILGDLMSDPAKAPRVVQAFLKMKKFDIEKLINA